MSFSYIVDILTCFCYTSTMLKVKPTTKEQLVYFLHNNISLSTYDKKFINSIITNFIPFKKPVTTNQDMLLNKIVKRYVKQFSKSEIDVEEIVKIPWSIEPIPSSAKFTQAYIGINNDTIEITCPFKGDFIKKFKTVPFATWNKVHKKWMIPLCEQTLWITTKIVKEFYSEVNYDENVSEIFDSFKHYESVKFWNPTLVKVNERLLIAASNRFVDEAISNIELSTDYHTLSLLVYHGITIDESVYSDLDVEKYKHIISRKPVVEYDVDVIVNYLLDIKCDFVYFNEISYAKDPINFYSRLKKALEQNNINFEFVKAKKLTDGDFKKYKLPVLLSTRSFVSHFNHFVAKTICVVNSNSIEIK